MKSKFKVAERGSVSVQAVEWAWSKLQNLDRRIPNSVIVLHSEESSKQGHFKRHSWRTTAGRSGHEIGINANLLDFPDDLLGTLVHEAAHSILVSQGDFQAGCSGKRLDYHKVKYRDMAIEMGLTCSWYSTRHGWNNTDWPAAGVPQKYQRLLKGLVKRLPAGTTKMRPLPPKSTDLPKPGMTPAICGCDPPRKIYGSKSVLELGNIVCGYCERAFV